MDLQSTLFHVTKAWAISAIIVGVVSYTVGWIIYATTFHPLSKIPGPFLARISRFWMLWRVYAGDTHTVQRALHAKYGPVVRIAHDEVCCSSPQMIPRVYRTHGPLKKSEFYPPWNKRVLSKYPDHFSSTDEKQHAERRRIVSHVYSLSNVLRCEKHIDHASELFIRRLGSYTDNTTSNALDLGEWLQWYAFDNIGQLFFGKMFGFMDKASDHESYIASLDALIPVICMIATAPSYLRGFIMCFSFLSSIVRRGLEGMDRIIRGAVECVSMRVDDKGQAIDQERAPEGDTRHDLLQQFLDIFHSKGERIDFTLGDIQLEVWGALLAGSDTTSVAMRAIFYYLLKTPRVYKELQQEIDTATEDGLLSIPPKYSEVIQLPFLCATIKEGMRMHPSAGFSLPRISPEGGVELCDRFIPAGYKVGINAAVVGFDTDTFGLDAEEFNPRRWMVEDIREMDKATLNFGAGTRTCLGKNISLLQIHKVIPYTMQNFDLRLEDPSRTWTVRNQWLNRQTGLIVKLSRR